MIFRLSGRGRGSAAAPSFPPEAARKRARAHWRATRGLMATAVVGWALFAFLAAPLAAGLFASSESSSSATLLSGTAIPIIFVVLVFAFANSQGAIDRMFRVSDTD